MMPQDYREEDPLQAFREERLAQKRRRPAILIGIVVGVAVAAAVGWMTFGKYVSLYGDTNGELPVIKADTALYRIRPKTPGGMEVPDQDKLIYDRLRSSDGDLSVERLLPPPEKPEPPEPEKNEVLPAEVKQSNDPIGALAEHVSEPTELASGTVYDESGVPVEVMFRTVPPVPEASKNEKSKPVEKKPDASEKIPPAAEKTAPAVATVRKPEAPAKKEPAVSAEKETPIYSVQLISARTEAAAEGEWKRLSRKHKDLMKGLSHSISKVTVGKGVFYRLRVGSFDTREEAKALCDRFKAQKQECIVAK